MEATIKLELGRDATRAGIVAQLRAMLDEGQVSAIGQQVAPLRESGGHFHDLPEVLAYLGSAGLEPAVRDDAAVVYRILAEAEAKVHGCAVEETHFHEVGNASSVASVLEVCLAVNALGRPRVLATPVQVGRGQVRCAHGLLDIPAPATAAIISRGIPIAPEKLDGELCTPTSAAIILHFVDEFAD